MYMENILGIKGIKVVKQGRHFSTRGNNVKIAKSKFTSFKNFLKNRQVKGKYIDEI